MGSEERAERVGWGIRTGTIWVNTYLVRDLTAPSAAAAGQ
jgi:betaine-aldehyde dehydrogenase/5-carboxymethyl-2-hydroxymuconic-semialdehyde dehydrogenase